jgi:hypothetical protein
VNDAPFAVVPSASSAPDAPFALPAEIPGVREHFEAVRAAQSFDDYLAAGWQQSVTGLVKRGRAPDVALSPDSPWYGRLASSVAGLAGDVPAMIGGYLIGAAAGGAVGGGTGAAAGTVAPGVGTAAGAIGGGAVGAQIGGSAGAFALPAGLRAALMDAYTKGHIATAQDFLERAMHVSWETFKGGVTGAATAGAGIGARAVLPAAAPAAVRLAAPTAAEIATMATVSRGLEGQLPEPEDFLDAAVVLGGMKGAAHVAGRLRAIYAATGKHPSEVVMDAAANPKLAEQIKAPAEAPMIEIPEEYRPLANAEAARAAVPDYRTNEAAALDITAAAIKPFAEVPQVPGEPTRPTHVNYNFLNTSDEAKAALARLSEIYEERIQAQRRGAVSWEDTSAEAERILSDTLGGVDTSLIRPRDPGTAAGAAELLARKQLVIGAAEDMATRAKAYLAKGAEASPEETVAFLASIERASMIQSEFLGARAEAGRALNILRSTARDAERAKQIQQVVEMYGKDPATLADMITQLDNPTAALKFAKEATKATTWDKIVEAWKAGLLSGPLTHMRNLLGNASFAATRPAIDVVAAGFGALRSSGERVTAMEPIARIIGNIQGTVDGARYAGAIMRTGRQEVGKSEQYREAIGGKAGTIIRTPFRLLSAADAFFRTLNERGEAYALATRQATVEGLHPLTREFQERVAQLVRDPSAEMVKTMEEAGARFTFNADLGDTGKALQRVVRVAHLEFLFPFIRTPANILKETVRLTPFAPALKEWREAIKAGGAARDKAMAELATGTAFMGAIFLAALRGNITGAGEPDAGKRRIQYAAGWQPYSVKIGDTYYSYQGWGPITTLVGIAADMATVWDHTSDEEADKIPKILAVAFANAVTNQTALMGMTNLVNVTSDPTRYGPQFFKGLAGSIVPALANQAAQWIDPVQREVNGTIDAIKARVPGLRETLLPKRDVFGEPVEAKERLVGVTPITETTQSKDKVRLEAARLGLSAAAPPKKVHVGRGSGKLGETEITPEQRDVFADVGGHLAHEILAPIVNSPNWDGLPDLVKKRIYAKAFLVAHKQAALAAIPPGLRATIMDQITEKLQAELSPTSGLSTDDLTD